MSAFDNSQTRRKVDSALRKAFEESGYMQRMGTGDVQSVCLAVDQAHNSDDPVAFLTGAVAATAMTNFDIASHVANLILNPAYEGHCESCESELGTNDAGECLTCGYPEGGM